MKKFTSHHESSHAGREAGGLSVVCLSCRGRRNPSDIMLCNNPPPPPLHFRWISLGGIICWFLSTESEGWGLGMSWAVKKNSGGGHCTLSKGRKHKVFTYIEYRAVSGVYRTIDPPTPLHPAIVSSPRTKGGGLQTRRTVRGWGSIFRKTPDIGLASYGIIPLRSGAWSKYPRWRKNRSRRL